MVKLSVFKLLPGFTPTQIADWPLTWTLVGLAIGLGLGVNTVSAWLVVLGLVAFVANLSRHDPLVSNDGYVFSGGPAFIMAWVLGFIIRGWAF